MNLEDSSSESVKKAEPKYAKTQYANLYRYNANGTYVARLKIKGKEIWRVLDTISITTAKLRLNKLEKEERQRMEASAGISKNGKMKFSDALAIYLKRLDGNTSLKPASKIYRKERIAALLKSWPELENVDVRKITKTQCLNWEAIYKPKFSATNFNNTSGSLKLILDIAVETGMLSDNPAKDIERARVVVVEPVLPSPENFHKVVSLIKHKTVADLVCFLAYSGMRISEAKKVLWQDVDFEKGHIVVKGDKITGTKNWEIRRVPIIPDMEKLLRRISDERPEKKPTDTVMLAKEFRASVKTACRKISIPSFNHHAMRHLFITRCMELSIDPRTIAEWCGHKDGGALIFKRYAHVRPLHSAEMAKNVTFALPSAAQSATGSSKKTPTA